MKNNYLAKREKTSRWKYKNIGFELLICGIWLMFSAISCTKQKNIKPKANKNPSKPNIIFIMADDMGYHDLGSYSQTSICTPNIDKLARQGMKFTNAYAGATVCAPSRSVLMTGQHTGHTRVRGNFATAHGGRLDPKNRVPLQAQDTTVTKILKDVGYTTGMVGKWGLGYHGTSGAPIKHGFDQYIAYLNQHKAHNHYAPYVWKNGQKLQLKKNKNGIKGQYTEDLFQKFALNFIRKNASTRNPFFLYMPLTLPHPDYQIPKIDSFYRNKSWPHDAKVYASMVTKIDQYVGQIMHLLKKEDIDRHTIVFLCSDNGAGRYWKGTFTSSGVLRGHKRDLMEGGIRTPMIVRWPGHVPDDTVSSKPWYFADVLPTLVEVAGAQPPKNIDGINVLPTLLGSHRQQLADRFMYWEYHPNHSHRQNKSFEQAARWRHWKALRLGPGTPLQLYDLSVDPGEQYNVASLHPAIARKMNTYLDTSRTQSQYWPISDNNKQ